MRISPSMVGSINFYLNDEHDIKSLDQLKRDLTTDFQTMDTLTGRAAHAAAEKYHQAKSTDIYEIAQQPCPEPMIHGLNKKIATWKTHVSKEEAYLFSDCSIPKNTLHFQFYQFNQVMAMVPRIGTTELKSVIMFDGHQVPCVADLAVGIDGFDYKFHIDKPGEKTYMGSFEDHLDFQWKAYCVAFGFDRFTYVHAKLKPMPPKSGKENIHHPAAYNFKVTDVQAQTFYAYPGIEDDVKEQIQLAASFLKREFPHETFPNKTKESGRVAPWT